MTPTPRLVVRCDANASSGLGHFTRCCELASALQRVCPELGIAFAGDYAEHARRRLEACDFAVLATRAESPFRPETLLALLAEGDRLLVDSYLAEPSFFQALTARHLPWAAFDDFARHDFFGARLVVNFRLGAEAWAQYAAQHSALGADFFPTSVRLSEVRVRSEEREPPATPRRALVFVGGEDRYGVGPRLARLAAEALPEAEITLISAEPGVRPSHARVSVHALEDGLEARLATTDLVVSGGGRLKYEACFALVPNAAVSQTAEQAEDTALLAELGLCRDLGSAEALDETRIAGALCELAALPARQAQRRAQAVHFAPHGTERLAEAVRRALSLD